MADDPIDSLTANTPPADAGPQERTCEFCGCRLSRAGEVLKMSEKARAMRQLEDRLAKEQAEHVATKAELSAAIARAAELQRELDAAKNPGAAPGNAWGPKF